MDMNPYDTLARNVPASPGQAGDASGVKTDNDPGLRKDNDAEPDAGAAAAADRADERAGANLFTSFLRQASGRRQGHDAGPR